MKPMHAPPAGPPRTGAAGARGRALAFQAELEDALATRVEPGPLGDAVFHNDLPRVTGLNVLRISQVAGELDAAALMAEADRLQGGLPQRAIRVDDERDGDRLAPGFAAAGWAIARSALMILRHDPDRAVDASTAAEVNLDLIRSARAATIRRAHRDLNVAAEVVDAGALPHDELPATAVAAIVGSEVAAYCVFRSGRNAAKLTEVGTLDRASGRGVSRAVLHAAAALALRGRPLVSTTVFVETPDEEWEKSVYRRLGFEERGVIHRFIRPWGDEGRLPPPI